MAPFPLFMEAAIGKLGAYLVFALIGFAFGFTLEIAGFGNSEKLAAQFYFKDLTVLKVMFTAIIVAMVGIFGASALGLLDLNLIWVNPTYMWPGIVGGLLMGVGFIVGGFCPGTSLVAMATAKIDGLFFVLGVAAGILLFGETVDSFAVFWNSSYMGRFTLDEWLGVPTGWVVLGVVLMALFMFWGGEQLERIYGGLDPRSAPRGRYVGAGALVAVALVVLAMGQPDTEARWSRIETEREIQLVERQVQLQPGEVLHIMHDHQLKLVLIDVREEVDYNLFHLANARHVPLDRVKTIVDDLHFEPPNTVVILMSNDESRATEAWKVLVAESVPNVYILDGGINGWLATFAEDELGIAASPEQGEDTLRYDFASVLGASYECAAPSPEEFELEYETRLKLELKRGPAGGGCG